MHGVIAEIAVMSGPDRAQAVQRYFVVRLDREWRPQGLIERRNVVVAEPNPRGVDRYRDR